MYLHYAHTPVQILKQALSVLQITKSFLVVLVVLVDTEKFKGLLYLVYIRRTESEFQTDMILKALFGHVPRGLRDEVHASLHSTSRTHQLV